MPRLLPREFYQQDLLTCAQALVGATLVWNGCLGAVVEVEAYAAEGDEACHAFSRPSTRDFIHRHPAGTAYVYFNYGVHWMLNVLVKGGGRDGLILIRAIEPLVGIEAMQARRRRTALRDLCSGPGKLTQALAITGADHERDLCSGTCGAALGAEQPTVLCDVRVGISRATGLPWRFLWKESPFASVAYGKALKPPKPTKA
jgi:DNA-3-methyladenine glycosylase